MAKRKKPSSADLSADSRTLLRHLVAGCLKAQGLPNDAKAVSGAIELIDAGFAVIRHDGGSCWLEAVDGPR